MVGEVSPALHHRPRRGAAELRPATPIAERLGYGARAGQIAVERFMKHYFLIAKDVGDLTAIVCAALEERQARPPKVRQAVRPAPPAPEGRRRSAGFPH